MTLMNSEFEAFLTGYKPALLCNPLEDQEIVDRLWNYPHIRIRDVQMLFFQNEELQSEYIERSQGLVIGEPEHHRLLGITLGYPPIAADYFARSWIDRRLWDESVAFDYYGLFFAGHIHDVIPIAEWLWENVPIPPAEVTIITISGRKYRLSPNL